MLLHLQIALRREKMGETAPFWRFSAASYPDLERAVPVNGVAENTNDSPKVASTSSSVCILKN